MSRFDRLDLNNGMAEVVLQEPKCSVIQKHTKSGYDVLGLTKIIVMLLTHFLSTWVRWSYMEGINLNCRVLKAAVAFHSVN